MVTSETCSSSERFLSGANQVLDIQHTKRDIQQDALIWHVMPVFVFRAAAFPVFSFLFLIEQPVRGLASGVLGDLVADEVYLYFMVIVAPPPTHSSQKKLSGQDISSYF